MVGTSKTRRDRISGRVVTVGERESRSALNESTSDVCPYLGGGHYCCAQCRNMTSLRRVQFHRTAMASNDDEIHAGDIEAGIGEPLYENDAPSIPAYVSSTSAVPASSCYSNSY